MAKIILCSSSDLNLVDEYVKECKFSHNNYKIEYEFGNSYITELINDIKFICNSNKKYFVHTYSNEVLELFAKYLGDSELRFVRLYQKDEKLLTVDYNKEEFIENISEGWELR